MNKTDLISKCIIFLCAGIFIGFILTMVYVKDIFRQELIVSVTPQGISNIYLHDDSLSLRHGRIDRQNFKVVFKNGVQVSDTWIGYKYGDVK